MPKDRAVKIWVADEAWFGLHTQSRVLGFARPAGRDPQQQRYQWEYVYGALELLEGGAQFCFLPSVTLDLSRDFLQQIAASDPQAEHVVLWDQAGFHPRATDPYLPERIHLLALPPYSPELNPVEGLRDQVQDVTCNRRHESLDAFGSDPDSGPPPVLGNAGPGLIVDSSLAAHPSKRYVLTHSTGC